MHTSFITAMYKCEILVALVHAIEREKKKKKKPRRRRTRRRRTRTRTRTRRIGRRTRNGEEAGRRKIRKRRGNSSDEG